MYVESTKQRKPKRLQKKTGQKLAKGNNPSYEDFVDWHVDRVRQQPYPGNTFDYMEFPIHWDRSRPLIEHLHYIFKVYIAELKEFGSIGENVISNCKTICEDILWIMAKSMNLVEQNARKGDSIKSKFEKICGKLKINPKKIGELSEEKEDEKEPTKLYRLRCQKNLFMHEDFYHVPFDKLYLSNTERFSAMGYPCLYLGYSEEDCLVELEEKKGTIAELVVNEDSTLNIIDITQDAFCTKTDSTLMLLAWPLLAACYVAVPRPESRPVNFKEEYVFPQHLTRYLLEKGGIDGIRYYSCRKKDLDPQKEDYMNLVLFTKMHKDDTNHNDLDENERKKNISQKKDLLQSPVSFSAFSKRYDMGLMNKFKITKIYTVDYENKINS